MNISEYPTISSIKDGEKTSVPVLVKEINERESKKTGRIYYSIVLRDKNGENNVNFFDLSESKLKERGIEVGRVYMAIILRKGAYLNGEDIYVCTDKEITANCFVSAIEQNPEELFADICRQVLTCKEPETEGTIADLTLNLYARYKEQLLHSSAAKSVHHNALGGLIMHTSSMVKMAMCYADNYPSLDRELLVCGAALHDIGKLRELETSAIGEASYTPAGALLGHLAIGVIMVNEEAGQGNYDPERVMLLQHLIACHHGRTEFGAIKNASIPEAEVLYHIDDADASIQKFIGLYKEANLKPGEVSTKQYRAMENYLYRSNNNQ